MLQKKQAHFQHIRTTERKRWVGWGGQEPWGKKPIERKAKQKQIIPNNLSFWIKLCLKYYSWVFPFYESISPVLQKLVCIDLLSFAQERIPNWYNMIWSNFVCWNLVPGRLASGQSGAQTPGFVPAGVRVKDGKRRSDHQLIDGLCGISTPKRTRFSWVWVVDWLFIFSWGQKDVIWNLPSTGFRCVHVAGGHASGAFPPCMSTPTKAPSYSASLRLANLDASHKWNYAVAIPVWLVCSI